MSNIGRSLIRALQEDRGTWQFYKDKPFFYRLKMWFYLSDLFNPIQKVITFYNIQKERINRLWHYGKYIWGIGEWDWNWHLGLQLLSLKRLYTIMENGSSVFSKTRKRKMRTAIALLERMNDPWESYHVPADEAFTKKWGFVDDYKLFTHPTQPQRFYTSRHAFRDSLKGFQQKQFDKEYKEVLFIEDKMFAQDMELFCKIWKRNLRSWWD